MTSRVWSRLCAWWNEQAPLLWPVIIQGGVAGSLAIILWSAALLWPVPYLGVAVHPETGQVVAMTPGSAAAQAGLRVGDQVLRAYDRPWSEVVTHPNTLSLIPQSAPISFTVQRGGAVIAFQVPQVQPSGAFQVEKLSNLILALLCWLTGYVLGRVRRHETADLPGLAVFWLGLSAVVGSYLPAYYGSLPLRLLLQWLIITMLAPAALAIHAWFPRRTEAPQQLARWRRWLLGSSLLLNMLLGGVVLLIRPALVQLVFGLSLLVPVALLLAFAGSALLLVRVYRATSIAHLRRQIRLLGLACLLTACLWLCTFAMPVLAGDPTFTVSQGVNVIAGLVPLAYLLSSRSRDLYWIDRLAIRLVSHVLTATLLLGLLGVVPGLLGVVSPTGRLWLALAAVVLYRPALALVQRLIPPLAPPHDLQPLHQAAAQLNTTLDASTLAQILVTGIRAALKAPLALYGAASDGAPSLVLLAQDRLPDAPRVIKHGALLAALPHERGLVEHYQVQVALAGQTLSLKEQQLVYGLGAVLWGTLRPAQGELLGLLVLGPRGDLDPYRPDDLRELQRLLDTASLAFTNSRTYAQQQKATTIIRQLYQRLQVQHNQTAAAIARELHDEVLNITVRLNLASLETLLGRVTDPALRAELELVVQGEQSLAETLRMICEQLHPAGIDDPLGLEAVLRTQVNRVRALWDGPCHFHVAGSPVPLAPEIQWEAMRITREALTNAIKHAQPVEISVALHYPSEPDGQIEVVIQDWGPTTNPIVSHPGHLGIRNMQEGAQAVGGKLLIERTPGVGTTVRFICPARPPAPETERERDRMVLAQSLGIRTEQ